MAGFIDGSDASGSGAVGFIDGSDASGWGVAGLSSVARALRAPASIQLHMLGNVAIDALVGTIPLLGDLFDFAFKAQTRNLALLEHWLQSPQATERRSRRGLIVVPLAVLLLFVGLTITGLWVLYLVIHWLFTAAAG